MRETIQLKWVGLHLEVLHFITDYEGRVCMLLEQAYPPSYLIRASTLAEFCNQVHEELMWNGFICTVSDFGMEKRYDYERPVEGGEVVMPAFLQFALY